jgi:hypothetical protein
MSLDNQMTDSTMIEYLLVLFQPPRELRSDGFSIGHTVRKRGSLSANAFGSTKGMEESAK